MSDLPDGMTYLSLEHLERLEGQIDALRQKNRDDKKGGTMTDKRIYNEPAFPVIYGDNHFPGMTLRDYFATAALQGMLACSKTLPLTYGQFAEEAYKLADALLVARG